MYKEPPKQQRPKAEEEVRALGYNPDVLTPREQVELIDLQKAIEDRADQSLARPSPRS